MSNVPYTVIAESIDYLVANYDQSPSLDQIAARAGYESTYFQKLFKSHVGISPKRLIQYMNVRKADAFLMEGHTLMDAAHEAGLSGTGRLHDLYVNCLAVTPGDMAYKGQGLEVQYGYHPSALGEILVAKTQRGVCYVGFIVDQDRSVPEHKMRSFLRNAVFVHNDAAVAHEATKVKAIWKGNESPDKPLELDLHGTNLQIQVWVALLSIPSGKTRTYGDIAMEIGKPRAARAVGNAVGANPVSLLIPCHRVIRSTGIIDNYGWGSARKKLILACEAESRFAIDKKL